MEPGPQRVVDDACVGKFVSDRMSGGSVGGCFPKRLTCCGRPRC
jgi:hypothetical protein